MTIIESAVANLSNLSNKQGYITFDDIMATADTYHLSLTEVDILSEALNDKGILIYESHPDFTDDDFDDYSRTDYEAIFKEVTDINPSLQNLIDSIRKINPPQWGEMSSLAKQAKNGNSYARERMILLYLRNAIKVALSMAKQYNLSIEDAISSAISGLITAVDRFDPNGFSAFNSYASMWMQQNINRDCNPVWFEYYYPVHAKEKIQKVKALYAVLDEGSDEETVGLLQSYTNYSFNEINYYLSQIESQMNKLSIEDIIENEEDETFYELSYKSQINSIDEIDELLDYERMKATLDNILNTLTEKEKKVLSLRFGLEEGMPPMTLEEVGEVFNVTRERIRQIEQKALRKLRHPSRARPLAGYLD